MRKFKNNGKLMLQMRDMMADIRNEIIPMTNNTTGLKKKSL